ncbi:MAG: hypothetical protein Q4C44_01720 [bacterium]|nr:hypothetical protein [bacterium]
MERVKHFLGILVAILFLPTIVFADESYITYSDIKCNGQNVMGGSSSYSAVTNIGDHIEYTMNGQKDSKYSFVITGFNLNADEEYTYTLTSDFKNFKKTYTGAELMAGVTISGEDGNSMMESKLVDAYNKSLRNMYSKYTTDDKDIYFDITRFNFNKNFDFTEMDAIYSSMLNNGKVKVASVDPLDDTMFAETAITAALSKYETDRYRIVGGCYKKNKCMVNISDKVKTYRGREYETTFEFATPNSKIKNRLDGYAKTFVVDNQNIEEHLFLMEDLETINYKYAFPSFGEWIDSINAIINYSSEFQNKIGYMNIGTKLDVRAGWDDQFASGCFGFLNLLFDGVIYSYVDTTGVKQNNVLYVPDETENTREAYIKAALDRVNKYIPKANVKIEYAGQIADINDFGVLSLKDIVDVNKTLGEYYKVTIGEEEYYYFIAKDSSKMRTPVMNTVDALTDISIKTEASEVPLDSKINTVVIDAKSDEYKEFLKKVNINNGLVVDLKLFSDSINKNISKLDDGVFKVYVPLNDELRKLDLTAYYVKDNGEIEKHDVKIDGDYLVFDTDHFSTYVIGGNKLENPATLDNVSTWIITTGVSLLGLASAVFYKRKFNN